MTTLALLCGCQPTTERHGADTTDGADADLTQDISDGTDQVDAQNTADAGPNIDATSDAVDTNEDPCALCGDDALCVDARCVPNPPCGCALGEQCSPSGRCVPGCDEDIACGLGARCIERRCVDGCQDDTHCGASTTCRSGRCRARCDGDQTCDADERCVNGACEPTTCDEERLCPPGEACEDGFCNFRGSVECIDDDACGERWRCGPDGSCVQCLSDDDCPPADVCEEAACVRASAPLVHFERRALPGIPGTFIEEADPFDFGSGFALLDADGDGRVDLAFGQDAIQGTPLCLYRNITESDGLAFEPVTRVCNGGFFPVGYGAADFDGDGADELIIGEPGAVTIITQEDDVITLPANACLPGAFLPIDLDADGDLDLYVGCQRALNWNPALGRSDENVAFVQGPPGTFELVDAEELQSWGISLALGAVDLQEDGLLDIVVANDSFSNDEQRNVLEEPGYRFIRCAPGSSCTWNRTPSSTAWRPGARLWEPPSSMSGGHGTST